MVVSLTTTERSWVQASVLALFLIEDGVEVKAEIYTSQNKEKRAYFLPAFGPQNADI